MNTKDQIKQAIKEAGFNLRQVSVRSRRGGYDSSFCLTIRDASVSKKQIKEIALSFKSVSYCEASQEILCGGNTWVDVSASEEVLDVWAEKYEWLVKGAIEEGKDNFRIGRFWINAEDKYNMNIYDKENRHHFSMNYYNGAYRSMAIDMYLAEQN